MNKMGTKLTCLICGAQVIVTRGGEGTLRCHDEEMQQIGSPGSEARRGQAGEAVAASPPDPFGM